MGNIELNIEADGNRHNIASYIFYKLIDTVFFIYSLYKSIRTSQSKNP